MLAPVLILLGIFVIWPALYAVYLSFQDWSFYKEPEWVGWRNYRNVLVDPMFRAAVVRGFQFVLMTVPVVMTIVFFFASLVVAVSKKFATVLKVTIYIPTIISAVITSIVFGIIYEYSGGILNWALAQFGIDRIAALMAGTESIRDVIAFPKTTGAQCLMTGAPSPIADAQLAEVHVAVRAKADHGA